MNLDNHCHYKIGGPKPIEEFYRGVKTEQECIAECRKDSQVNGVFAEKSPDMNGKVKCYCERNMRWKAWSWLKQPNWKSCFTKPTGIFFIRFCFFFVFVFFF